MSAFEDFVNLELPKRPPMLTFANTGFDGDPNVGAPANIANAPQGTFFFRNTGNILYVKNSSSPGTWAVSGGGGGGGAVETTDRTIYVSPSGNDTTGDGTFGNPYLTIAKARSTVFQTISADITIKLAAGTYSELIPDTRTFLSDAVTGKASLLFEGDFADFIPTTGPATGTFDVSFGTPVIPNTALVTGATWTTDELAGKFVELTSGTFVGLRLPIINNAADTLDMGGPADRTTSGGVDIRGANFKFVQPSVIFNHPLTTTSSLVVLSGSTNLIGGGSGILVFVPSLGPSIKPRRAFGFYGIKFTSATPRPLVQCVGNGVRLESCVFEDQTVTSLPTATLVSCTTLGSRIGSAACYFTAQPVSNTQITHMSAGNNAGANVSTTFSAFNLGNTAVLAGIGAAAGLTSLIAQGQRFQSVAITGGTLTNTGGMVLRNNTLIATFSSGILFGSNPNSSAFLFTSQPTIGATKILNCNTGIAVSGPTTFSSSTIRNMIIDGCGVGVWIGGPSSLLTWQSSEIKNCTSFGVRVGAGFVTGAEPFYAGFSFAAGGVTMTGNVSGDFSFDGLTAYSQAFISAAPGKLLVDGRGNYILGN